MNYKKLKMQELKSICKKLHIKGYSSLNKDDLIKIIKKNLKSRKNMKGGGQIEKKNMGLTREELLILLNSNENNLKTL